MKLALQHSNYTPLPVKAACIRGSSATTWLMEISRWKIPVDQLECYLLPQSIHSIEPAGLFVVFRDVDIRQIDFLEPYTCVEQKLFIPVNSELVPPVSGMEMKTLLRWPLQVYHPVIGLIGFEKEDAIQPGDLFFYSTANQQDWSFAHPGIFPRPAFSRIDVMQPSAEELIEEIQKEIGQQSLLDIPKDRTNDPSAVEKLVDNIKYGILKALFTGAQQINKLLPEAGNGNNQNTGEESLLQKLGRWLHQNLEELEKKRKDEISRLLNMFDEDTDEALQYAIPLDSPYLNRGSSHPVSSSLSRNPLDFNLGRLGGGRRVDTWDVSDRYNDLRTKYLKAAEKEIEKKDFKKAAYVYAHLLGDYNGAANVLEQGKMYREAAALHKDHLKNIAAAAECLERGALYNEAIELYKDLKKDEKIGDLYCTLQQQTQAAVYYEKHIDIKIKNNDYLDAARVMNEKLEAKERAKQTLIDGWDHSYQYEPCLKKYFEIVLDTETESAASRAKNIFSRHMPKHKRLPFLNALEYLNFKKNDEDFTSAAREMAYEIVHDEASAGNVHALHSLKKFFPNDKLIGADTSRFSTGSKNISGNTGEVKGIHLDPSIQWLKAAWHRNQFLVIGIKNTCLHMARCNWYGNLEYYSWTNPVKEHSRFIIISKPYYTNHILLHTSDVLPITRKSLSKNKYFNEALIVNCPISLHKGSPRLTLVEDKGICRIDEGGGAITLHWYTMSGDLKKSIDCTFLQPELATDQVTYNAQLVYHSEYFYTNRTRIIMAISATGSISAIEMKSGIRLFAASFLYDKLYLVISTYAGCYLCRAKASTLTLREEVFAEVLIPDQIVFIASNKFVITEKRKAHLFEIVNEMPEALQQFETNDIIVSVLPTSNRNQFALIEQNGKITLCDYGI